MRKLNLWTEMHDRHPMVILRKNSKKPVQKNWPNRAATLHEIQKAFQEEMNVGIRTDNLLVVDVDELERARRFFLMYQAIITIVCRTIRGCHFYFLRAGKNIDTGNRVKVDGEFDIRSGPGGYVVFAQSQINGQAYSLVPGFDNEWDELKEFPLDLSLPTGQQQSIAVNGDMCLRAREYLKTIEPAIEGFRDNTTFRVACVLIQKFNLSQAQAWPLLLEFNDRCQPPLEDMKQLRRKLAEAERLRSA